MPARIGNVVAAGGVALLLVLAGCTSALGLFDSEFLTALGMGAQVASIPGEAPALLVAVENQTDRLMEAVITYRTQGGTVESFASTVQPGERTAQALICPIEEITIGDVGDVNAVGALVFLGTSTADPYIEVEPLGVVLKDGVNYDCGDSLTFAVQRSGVTESGFRLFAYIQRAGGGG